MATPPPTGSRSPEDCCSSCPSSAPRASPARRALSIAAEAIGSVAVLVAPVIDMNIVAGRLHWLAAYPVLVGTGLIAAAFGLAAALLLFAMMGPRRARLASQVGAALIGGGFVLAAQVANILPSEWRDALFAALAAAARGDAFENP